MSAAHPQDSGIVLACCIQNFNQWSFEDAARLTREIGFRTADIGKGQLGGFEALRAGPRTVGDRIRAVAARERLRLCELSVFDVGAQGGAGDPAACATAAFRACCIAAAEGGLESILGSIDVPTDHAPDSQAYLEARAEWVGRSVEIGQEYGLFVNIEPVFNGPLVKNPQAAVWLAEHVPGLGYTLDFAHFPAAGRTVEDAFALLPFTRHIHAKQSAPGYTKSLYHRGSIDFAKVVEELKRIQWTGVMALECLAYGRDDRFDFEVYEEVLADFSTVPAVGLVNHPVFQTVRLAYELDQLLRAPSQS